jgi:hypothetical protein
MTAFRAWRDGIRRVVSAPSVLVIVWATTTAISLPLATAIRADLARSLGRSLDAEDAARGMDYQWMRELSSDATGLAATVGPQIVGFSAAVDNLGASLDGVRRPAAIVAATSVFVLAWWFLSGGIIRRYANADPSLVPGFFASCRAFFFRFFRLGLITAIVYGLVFRFVHPWAAVLLLAAVNIVFDYAKVRTVVEGRRSVIIALVSAWRFIRKNPAAAIGVYLLDVLLFGIVLGGYAMIAPPGGGIGLMVWPTFAIGQAYILGRLAVRLVFWASETAVFLRVSGD